MNLLSIESRNFAPSTGSIVAILQILGSENQSSEKHASSTLQGPIGVAVVWLFCREVVRRDVRLDKNQVIQCDL